MFNYNNLQVTLRVSPEISPSNFYTKAEADNKFLQDIPKSLEGAVYGRSHDSWVEIDSNFKKLHIGFLPFNHPNELTKEENFEKLHVFAYTEASQPIPTRVKTETFNDKEGNTLWLCSLNPISSIHTISGLPVVAELTGLIEYKDTTYNTYKIEGLLPGSYTLNITLE